MWFLFDSMFYYTGALWAKANAVPLTFVCTPSSAFFYNYDDLRHDAVIIFSLHIDTFPFMVSECKYV